MSTEIIEMTADHQVVAGVKLSLGKARAMQIAATFQPLVERATNAVGKFSGVNVTSEDDIAGMKVARTARLALRQIRLEIEDAHKVQKEAAKIEGQCLDEIKRNSIALIKPEEDRLQACEDYAKVRAAERKAALRADRAAAMAQVEAITTGYVLEDMTDAQWLDLLESETVKFNQRKQREADDAKEASRLIREQAAERERLRIENDRLRAEQAAKDRAAAAERSEAAKREADARAEAESFRRQQAAAERRRADELHAQQQAELRRQEEEDRARRSAAQAPDAEKLRAFLRQLDDLYPGEATTDAGKLVFEALDRNVKKLRGWVIDKANELEEGGES